MKLTDAPGKGHEEPWNTHPMTRPVGSMRKTVQHTISMQPATVGELREAVQILADNNAPDSASVSFVTTLADRPGETNQHSLRVSW